jgi:hypothetical protein
VLFKTRYRKMIEAGDPNFSPLLSTLDPKFSLRIGARCPLTVKPRTVRNFLPKEGG